MVQLTGTLIILFIELMHLIDMPFENIKNMTEKKRLVCNVGLSQFV